MTREAADARRPIAPPGSVSAEVRHALSVGDRSPGTRQDRCLAALKALRTVLARKAEIAPYAVAADTDLEALVRLGPTTAGAVRHVGVLPAETAGGHAEAFARVLAWFSGEDPRRAGGDERAAE